MSRSSLRRSRNHSLIKNKLLILACLILLISLAVGIFCVSRNEVFIENAGTSPSAQRKVLTRGDTTCPVRDHLQTILLIGTDSTEGFEELPENEKDFFTYHQADFLALLVLDRTDGSAQLLQINRDTMTDVPWLDVLGNYGGTRYTQICRAFNFGNGGDATCRNTADAVSRLLFGAPIDDYIQIPMTAVAALNDAVGGVPVTLTEDLTVIDPAFTAGASIRLAGQQAESFVRVRMALTDDTNISRMRRQRDYMESFYTCFRQACSSDSDFPSRLLRCLDGELQSSMTAAQLSNLLSRMNTSEDIPFLSIQGELKIVGSHYAFYADDEALWETAQKLFCKV